jgi:hypothetical protein
MGRARRGNTAQASTPEIDTEERQMNKTVILLAALVASIMSAHATMQDQIACAKAADNASKGWYRNKMEGEHIDYESHYNMRMNTCFVLFRTRTDDGKMIFVSRSLLDAVGNHEFGWYYWVNRDHQLYWLVKPEMCWVVMPSGQKKECNSSDEFDAAIHSYMTD